MRHSDCNHSDSTRRIVMKSIILLFIEILWKKIFLKSDNHFGYFLKGMPHLSKYLVGSSEIKNVSNTLC